MKLIVIIPVGPNTDSDFLKDTIESIDYYCQSSYRIILVNDSQKSLDPNVLSEKIDEVKTKKLMGKNAGLYFSICMAIDHALKNYNFEVILRMDDDAIISGFKPELQAIEYFTQHPNAALIGSYKKSWENKFRDFSPVRKQILIETSVLWKVANFIGYKKTNDISSFVKAAQKNDYELGEHVFGGAYFMSTAFAKALKRNHLLSANDFVGSELQEDQIFSILAFAISMSLGDFVTGDLPMCLKWRGMPMSVKNIHDDGKKVVHSTRFYKGLDEQNVRKQFLQYRT